MTGRFVRRGIARLHPAFFARPALRMRRAPVAAVLVLLLLAAASVPVQAQRVRAYVSADSVRVGDRFRLTVTAEHEAALAPVFPDVTDTLRFGDLEVLAQRGAGRSERGGLQVDSVIYEVTTFALDTAFVAPIPVRFTVDGDTARSAASTPFIVPVVSVVPPDAQDIRDLAPIVEFSPAFWPWVLLAVALLLMAAIAYYLWRRRRGRAPAEAPAAPAPPPEPYDEAVARLARLSEQPLEDPLATRAYYIELSDLLRHYLARRLHVNAMESTTGELVREMTRKKIVANEWVQQVRVVLELADFVKFAHGQPPTARSRAAVDEARHAIDGIEAIVRRREAAAAAPTEPAPAAGARVPEPS